VQTTNSSNIQSRTGSSLLAFDGIIVAATTFAAEKSGAFHKRGIARRLAVFTIVLALAASVACLLVSEISYPFFYFVTCNASHSLDYTEEINHLANLVDWRTAYFHLAWWCSLIAIPLFLMLFWVSLSGVKQTPAKRIAVSDETELQ
jgi:hypothetical protein